VTEEQVKQHLNMREVIANHFKNKEQNKAEIRKIRRVNTRMSLDYKINKNK